MSAPMNVSIANSAPVQNLNPSPAVEGENQADGFDEFEKIDLDDIPPPSDNALKSGEEILSRGEVRPGNNAPPSLKEALARSIEERYTVGNFLAHIGKSFLRGAMSLFGRIAKGFFNSTYRAASLAEFSEKLKVTDMDRGHSERVSAWKNDKGLARTTYEKDEIGTALGLRGEMKLNKPDAAYLGSLADDWKLEDIEQDPRLQDCWFLSSLSSVLATKGQGAIRDLVDFVQNEGTHELEFADIKLGKDVYRVPLGDIVDASGRNGLSDSKPWVRLFETAMQMHLIKNSASVNGGFYAQEHEASPRLFLHNANLGLSALAGVEFDPNERQSGAYTIREPKLAQIDAALKTGHPVVLGSPPDASGKLMAMATGISPGHAVSVLEVNRKDHTVTVMDPYGHATVLSEDRLSKFTMVMMTSEFVEAKADVAPEVERLNQEIATLRQERNAAESSCAQDPSPANKLALEECKAKLYLAIRERSILNGKCSTMDVDTFLKDAVVGRLNGDQELAHLFANEGFRKMLDRIPLDKVDTYVQVCKAYLRPDSNLKPADISTFALILAEKIEKVDRAFLENGGTLERGPLYAALFGKTLTEDGSSSSIKMFIASLEKDFLTEIADLLKAIGARFGGDDNVEAMQSKLTVSVLASVQCGMSMSCAIAFSLQNVEKVSVQGLVSKELLSVENIDSYSSDPVRKLGDDFGRDGARVDFDGGETVEVNPNSGGDDDFKARMKDFDDKLKAFLGYTPNTAVKLNRQYAAIMMAMGQGGHALFFAHGGTGAKVGAPQNHSLRKNPIDGSVDVTLKFPPYMKDGVMHTGGHQTVNIKVDGTNKITDFGLDEDKREPEAVNDAASDNGAIDDSFVEID